MKITFDIPATVAGLGVDVEVSVNWATVPRVNDTILGVPGQPGTWTVAAVEWVVTEAEPIVTLVQKPALVASGSGGQKAPTVENATRSVR